MLGLIHFLINTGFFAAFFIGVYILTQLPSSISFPFFFWGPIGLIVLQTIRRMSERANIFVLTIWGRFRFLKEFIVGGATLGTAIYTVTVVLEAGVTYSTWEGVLSSLTSWPWQHPIQSYIGLTILGIGTFIGLFVGRIHPMGNSYHVQTENRFVLWCFRFTRLTVTNPPHRKPLRGRSLIDYVEAAKKAVIVKPRTLWVRFTWRLFLIRRWCSRFFQLRTQNAEYHQNDNGSNEQSSPQSGQLFSGGIFGDSQYQTNCIERRGDGKRFILSESASLKGFSVYWAHLNISLEAAIGHFLVVGNSGSGKTVQLRLFLQSIFDLFGRGLDQRVLIYDGKNEYIPIVNGLGADVPVHVLNPFDERSVPWAISVDVTTPAAARQVASILIPPENSNQPFFADAARELLYGVILALTKIAPKRWTLRDVVLIFRNRNRLAQVLNLNEESKEIRDTFYAEPKTLVNILTTASTKLAPMGIVAALWDSNQNTRRTPRKAFSLKSWVNEEGVVILGNEPIYSEALGPVNRAMFKIASDILLSQPNSRIRRTWLLLDEFREGGKFEGVTSLLNQGRSKGISAGLGFQDISGILAVHGKDIANEITGIIRNKSVLRTDSSETAEWTEKHFGKAINLEKSTTVGRTTGLAISVPTGIKNPNSITNNVGESQSKTEAPAERSIVMASEVMNLPPPTPEAGFHGFHDVPGVGVFPTHLSWNYVFSLLKPKVGDGSVSRPQEDQDLRPWSEEDDRRLGIPPVPMEEPKEQKEPRSKSTLARKVELP